MGVAVQKTCPDCGEKFWNAGHHYESCTGLPGRNTADAPCTRCGATAETGLRDGCLECEGVVGPLPGRCQHRVPSGHGVWRYCVRPWNHEGGHLY